MVEVHDVDSPQSSPRRRGGLQGLRDPLRERLRAQQQGKQQQREQASHRTGDQVEMTRAAGASVSRAKIQMRRASRNTAQAPSTGTSITARIPQRLA